MIVRNLMHCAFALGMALVASTGSVALAQSDAAFDDEPPPPPPVILERIPPNFSWEIGLAPTFGTMTHFGEGEAAMPGLGVRGGWGRNFGPHRIGAGLSISLEGPVTLLWSNVLEPSVQYDYVNLRGLWLGASLGPSIMVDSALSDAIGYENKARLTAHAAARIGYSQTWTRVGRRFFVGLEPKVRIIDGQPSVLGALVIGSGAGY